MMNLNFGWGFLFFKSGMMDGVLLPAKPVTDRRSPHSASLSTIFLAILQQFAQRVKVIQDRWVPGLQRWQWQWMVRGARFFGHHRKNSTTQTNFARALLNSGQPEKAIVYAQQFSLQTSQIQAILAEAYHQLGDWEKSIEYQQRSVALEPENAAGHHALGKRWGQQENWQQAIGAYQKAIELDAKNPWFYYSLGIAQVKLGQWESAIQSLQIARRSLPREAWIGYYLGEALLAIDKTEQSIAIYKQTLKRSPWILYLWDCLAYANHVKLQDERIELFCQQSSDSAKPRMLMITPYPTYPPTTGAIVRMFHEMKAMSQAYDLTLVSFVFQKRDFEVERELLNYCQFAVTIVMGDCPPSFANQPQLIHRYSSERMHHVLKKLAVIPFNFVLTDFIQMAQYRVHFPNAFHILGEHNIESELLRRSAQLQSKTQIQHEIQQLANQHSAFQGFLGGLEEAEKLANYEYENWPKFDLRMVVSELDRAFLDQHCSIGKTIVVSNGIDTQTIQPLPDKSNKVVLFIGTLSYYPNVEGVQYFVQEILPLIWEQDAAVEFWVAGAEPPPVLLELGRDRRIKIIANPPDMTEVARQCCVMVVPLRIGSGTRIKILHGMALGLPIVTTSLGCEGIEVQDGEDLWIGDRPEAFAAMTLALLNDRDRRQQFRTQGRALVEQQYDWAAIFESAIGVMNESWG